MRRAILPIVEGDGELKAVPLLLRRMLQQQDIFDIQICHAQKRGEYPKVKRALSRFAQVATKEEAAILWIMDFDCDECECVVHERSDLMTATQAAIGDWPIEFCFMVKEYETIFLADVAVTRDFFRIPDSVAFPVDPESVRDAKGTISRMLPRGRIYKPTLHQERLTAQLSLEALSQASPSFIHMSSNALNRLVRKLPKV